MKAGAHSLSRRMIALVVGVSLAALLVHSAALTLMLRPVTLEPSGRMTQEVRSVLAALRFVPAPQREAFAEALTKEGLRVSHRQLGPRIDDDVPGRFAEPLRAALGQTMGRVEWAEDDGRSGLDVEVRVDGESWWIWVPKPRQAIKWWLLVALASVSAVALIMEIAALRMVTRPLTTLADEIRDRRRQLRQIDEPPQVSAEIQAVIRSFNSLVQAEEQSRRTRQDLLAGVSHDLRTPLARLRLRAETECPEAAWQAMEPDFLAVGRIVDQFLAYAQGQSGHPRETMRPVREIVEDAVARVSHDDWPVSLHEEDNIGGPAPEAPELPLQRAIANLLDNARAHGRTPVSVELRADGDEIRLMVFDAGRGISAADFERVQQPFVRLDGASTAQGHCGLGLAIVALAAGQLGGRTVLSPFDGVRSGVGLAWRRRDDG